VGNEKMGYQYTYLIYSALFATVWIVLYFWRKDTRKEMLMMSILFALAGPGADFLLTKDYWKPPTITGTAVGVESLIIGFSLEEFPPYFTKKFLKNGSRQEWSADINYPCGSFLVYTSLRSSILWDFTCCN
jgi:hypothetical protein